MIKTAVLSAVITVAIVQAHADVKPKMDQMMATIMELKPFIQSEAKYLDTNNEADIKASLQSIVSLSDKIKHEDTIKTFSRIESAKSLNENFKKVEETFARGNKSYSLWLLRSNLSNCVSCHTQLPAGSTRFGSNEKPKNIASAFEEAEFLYIIRNFDKAIELFNQSIQKYEQNNLMPKDLETILKRKVYYFTRVKRDLNGLSASLAEDQKNKNIPAAVARKFKSYEKAALALAKEPQPRFANDKELKFFAEKILAQDLKGNTISAEEPNLKKIWLSGHLYEYLEKSPNTELRPNIYYWLSFTESPWQEAAQSSLPETYLKKCVKDFPESPIAPRCYENYKDLINFAYTGSSGTHLPSDVKAELKKMRESLGVKK